MRRRATRDSRTDAAAGRISRRKVYFQMLSECRVKIDMAMFSESQMGCHTIANQEGSLVSILRSCCPSDFASTAEDRGKERRPMSVPRLREFVETLAMEMFRWP